MTERESQDTARVDPTLPDGEWDGIDSVREQRDQYAAENASLRDVCNESNAVCVCGCPASEHENYGDDGESCELDHECIRTSKAIYAIVHRLRADLQRMTEERDKWKTVVQAAVVEGGTLEAALRSLTERLEQLIAK